MTALQKLLAFGVPLLLLVLTGIAGYAYSTARTLHLPIPKALGILTVVLPVITGVSIQGVSGLVKRASKNEQYQLAIPLIAVIGFQLIYETVIATLALTYIVPPDSLECGLNDTWQRFWVKKDADVIRAIQDRLQCCGFRTVKDRAWPFASNAPSQCAAVFGRSKSCFDSLRKAEQINAGLLLLVATVVFVIKVLSMISLLTGASWSHSGWARPFSGRFNRRSERSDDDSRADMRRLIEGASNSEQYHDQPPESGRALEAPNDDAPDGGPRVVPSPLLDTSNEWREEENR